MQSFWDKRYAQEEYIYGEEPNEYLKDVLPKGNARQILFPAEGEGRNAVYAAGLDWKVNAFDASSEGRRKGLQLAEKKGVVIDYQVSSMEEVEYPLESMDALVLIYAHFPKTNRRDYHQKLANYLKPGGLLIIEGFSKEHALHQAENPKAGGPKNVDMLYNLKELKEDFKAFEFKEAYETETILNEGDNHVGTSSVIRILATKK